MKSHSQRLRKRGESQKRRRGRRRTRRRRRKKRRRSRKGRVVEVFIEVITKGREGEWHFRNALLQPLGTNLRQECG